VAWIIKGNLAVKYEVPESVAREIVSFDRHHDFRPGEYQLSAVPNSCRMGRKSGAHSGKTGGHRMYRKPLVSRPSEGMRGVKVYD
jgi:hypothetical protein